MDVHAAVDPERPTGTCVVLVEPGGERTMLPDPGANDAPLGPVPAGDHLHVVGYALLRDGPRASALAAIEHARAAGATVSVDPSSWALLRPGAIPEVDLLLPNEREARLLGEQRAGDVVKLGPAGARWSDGRDDPVPAGRATSSTPPAPATRSPPGCSSPASAAPDRARRSRRAAASRPAPWRRSARAPRTIDSRVNVNGDRNA